ncbi:MAG TPA: ABC transporter permease [Haliangiales bacterium]|nr:ABC transporter permease [Haliangiales bacterium]
MRAVRAWLIRLATTLRPGRRERELTDELESHLQLHIDDCIRRGMSPEEARREARLRLGGLAQAQEDMRARSRLPALESIAADVRFGARLLRKSPGFSAVAILTLALGIGANVAIFSVIDAVLLAPLPYPDPDELVLVGEGDDPDRVTTTSYATWVDWRARSRSFQELALFRDWSPTLTGGDRAEQLSGARVSAGFFRAVGVTPALGRDFRPEEDAPDTRRVAILGHELWRRRFGADPAIVGRTIALNETTYTVIGVLPASFDPLMIEATLGPRSADVWSPVGYDAAQPWACRSCRHLHVLGRLRADASPATARAELETLTAAMWREHPTDYADAGVSVVPLARQLVGPVRAMLVVLLGAVGCVLLIACVNLANLLLARATNRRREVAVRVALGAGRGRVLRQLLVENCLLALLGAAAGLVPAALLPQVLAAFGPRIPRLAEARLDVPVLLFALGLALATGLLSGLAPALRLTRADLHDTLRDGARSSAGAAAGRMRGALVVAEVALSLTLLVGAGLMVRSLARLLDVPPGFDPRGVLTLNAAVVGPRYEDDAVVRRHFDEVAARVRALPGVEAAAVASQIPLGGNFDGYGVHPEGRLAANPAQDPSAQRFSVSPGYIAAMRIPLVRGRDLAATDDGGAPPVLLVSQTTAERVWPGEDPLGKRVKIGGTDGPWWTVVGVVGDVRHMRLDQPPAMAMYVPYAQFPNVDSQMILAVRTHGPPLELAAAVEGAVRSVDASQPVSRAVALEGFVARSVAGRRVSLAMLAAFAVVALLLCAIGIYGVTSYAVAQRTRELGIRLALGARPGQLLLAQLRQGLALALAGIAAGVAAALGLTRFLGSLLYGVSATDPATFAGVALLLAAVALAASYLPARRVTRVDPTQALRAE